MAEAFKQAAAEENDGRTAWLGQHRFVRCCNAMDV